MEKFHPHPVRGTISNGEGEEKNENKKQSSTKQSQG